MPFNPSRLISTRSSMYFTHKDEFKIYSNEFERFVSNVQIRLCFDGNKMTSEKLKFSGVEEIGASGFRVYGLVNYSLLISPDERRNIKLIFGLHVPVDGLSATQDIRFYLIKNSDFSLTIIDNFTQFLQDGFDFQSYLFDFSDIVIIDGEGLKTLLFIVSQRGQLNELVSLDVSRTDRDRHRDRYAIQGTHAKTCAFVNEMQPVPPLVLEKVIIQDVNTNELILFRYNTNLDKMFVTFVRPLGDGSNLHIVSNDEAPDTLKSCIQFPNNQIISSDKTLYYIMDKHALASDSATLRCCIPEQRVDVALAVASEVSGLVYKTEEDYLICHLSEVTPNLTFVGNLLHGQINGIAIDFDKNIYITTSVVPMICKVDIKTNCISAYITESLFNLYEIADVLVQEMNFSIHEKQKLWEKFKLQLSFINGMNIAAKNTQMYLNLKISEIVQREILALNYSSNTKKLSQKYSDSFISAMRSQTTNPLAVYPRLRAQLIRQVAICGITEIPNSRSPKDLEIYTICRHTGSLYSKRYQNKLSFFNAIYPISENYPFIEKINETDPGANYRLSKIDAGTVFDFIAQLRHLKIQMHTVQAMSYGPPVDLYHIVIAAHGSPNGLSLIPAPAAVANLIVALFLLLMENNRPIQTFNINEIFQQCLQESNPQKKQSKFLKVLNEHPIFKLIYPIRVTIFSCHSAKGREPDVLSGSSSSSSSSSPPESVIHAPRVMAQETTFIQRIYKVLENAFPSATSGLIFRIKGYASAVSVYGSYPQMRREIMDPARADEVQDEGARQRLKQDRRFAGKPDTHYLSDSDDEE